MTNRISRRAIACALLATTALATPALAQNAGSETMPRNRQELDENGVNWATGEQVNYHTDVSIGPDGPGGLRLVRARGWGIDTSNYSMTMTGSAGVGFNVAVGQRSIMFNYNGSTYVPDDGSGATFVVNSQTQYTLTLEDGTVVVYKSFGIYDSYKARAISVTYPTGEKLTLAYNTIDWCTRITDNCTTFGHAVRLQSVSSSLGYQLHYSYARDDILTPTQANGWKTLVSVTGINTTINPCDPLAGSCTTSQSWPTATYDGVGGVTDPAGNHWTYSTSTSQFKIRRPSSGVDNVVVNIDANHRVSSVVRDGMTWNYSFTPGTGSMTAVRTDPLGHQETVVSDTNVGLPTSITDELGHVTTRAYNSSKQLTQETLPEGNYTHYSYDARGNVTEVRKVAKPGSGLADIVTSASYPASCSNAACNEPTATTDAKGNVTNYAYNADGSVQSITLPAPTTGSVRPQTRYSYTSITTPGGTVVSKLQSVAQCQTGASCAGTSDESKTTYSWSSQLLLTGVTRADGAGTVSATTTFTNDNVGNVGAIDGPLAGTGDTTTLRHDLMRREVGRISPDPDGTGPLKMLALRTTYNADGNVSKVERGTVNGTSDADWSAMSVLETQNIGYDSAARPVTKSVAGSDGVTQMLTQLSYDGESRLQCTAIRMNPAAFTSLPVDACTLGVQGSYGPDRISKYVYDAADRPTQLREGVGTADEAAERTLTYSNNGLITYLLDGENNLSAFIPDGFDRVGIIYYPNPNKGSNDTNGSDNEQFAYDANGNVTAYRTRSGHLFNFSYDNLDRRTVKVVPEVAWLWSDRTRDVYYAYDNLGRLKDARYDSITGEGISNSYDALSRLTTQTSTMGGVSRSFTSAYDSSGNRLTLTGHGGYSAGFSYDLLGRMTAYKEGNVTTAVTIGYDDLGRRSSMSTGADGVTSTTTYGYDSVSRLASIAHDFAGTANDVTQTFAYNPAGEATTETRSNDAYAFTGFANASTAYTSNGLNQLSNVGGAGLSYDANGNMTNDGSNSYIYDPENHLVHAGGAGAENLYYDPLGRMWLTLPDNGASGRVFAYDGNNELVREYDGAGTTLHSYVHGPGPDEVLVDYQDSPVWLRHFPHADRLGSVIAQADNDGNATPVKYDEYGSPQGGSVAGRFGYTGQVWLPEIQLYYYKARIYSPLLGRFMQTDPIGQAGDSNLYAYVHEDPLNNVDPFGLECEDITITGCRWGGRGGQCNPQPQPNYFGGNIISDKVGVPGVPGVVNREPIIVTAKRKRSDPATSSPSVGPGAPIIVTGVRVPIQIAAPAGPPPYNPRINYCGGGAGPRAPEGNWGPACYHHDVCYGTVGATKSTCDLMLMLEIYNSCRRQHSDKFCTDVAAVYWRAVSDFGSRFFNPHQWTKP